MAENKTKATEVSVDDYIEALPDPIRREDARTLRALMERISGSPATMWGPSIIGFGSYHYKYESGREGDACRIAFSPRKTELVLYLMGTVANQQERLAKLGKFRTGKGCLYVKKLADVDMAVVEALIVAALEYMDRTYPD